MLYFIILIFLIVLSLRFDFSNTARKGNHWFNLLLFIFIAIAGFRYKVGGDTLSYLRDFEDIPFLTELSFVKIWEYKYNPLWTLISSFSKSILDDFVFFQLIHACIVNIVLFRFIKNNTKYRFTAITLYYLFAFLYFNMEIMRESLAIALFILAYPFYKNNEWSKYYILILIAILFHFSAAVLLLLPIFKNTTLNFRSSLYIAGGVIVILVVFKFSPILDIILFSESLTTKYSFYSNYTANLNGMIGNFIMFGVVPFLIILLSKKVNQDHEKFRDLFLVYFTVVMFYVIVSGFGRFINYLIPFMIIFFADFLNELFRSRRYYRIRTPLVLMFLVITLLPKIFYYTRDTSELAFNTHRYNAWYPYSSVFKKEEFSKREALHREGLRRDSDR